MEKFIEIMLILLELLKIAFGWFVTGYWLIPWYIYFGLKNKDYHMAFITFLLPLPVIILGAYLLKKSRVNSLL